MLHTELRSDTGLVRVTDALALRAEADLADVAAAVTGDGPVQRTRRARYSDGRGVDHEVPAYAEEAGVDPRRRTETFAEIALELDSWRWAGTAVPAAKRQGPRQEPQGSRGALPLRSAPAVRAGPGRPSQRAAPRTGTGGLTMERTATGSRPETLTPLSLTARMDAPDLPAHGRLLLDVFRGDPALSIRGDEAEEAWHVVEPVLSVWERGLVPLEEYPAGSQGPPPHLATPERPDDLLHEESLRRPWCGVRSQGQVLG